MKKVSFMNVENHFHLGKACGRHHIDTRFREKITNDTNAGKFERHKGAANRMVNMIDSMSLRMKLSWYNNL